MSEKDLISLKDAAKVSGYSADYIGQLIRAGKIPGKQVYSGITWMTTADAVIAYKSKGSADAKLNAGEKLKNRGRLLKMEFDIIRLFFKTFKYSLPLLLLILASFMLLSFYTIYLFVSNKYVGKIQNSTDTLEEQSVAF